MNRMLSCRPPRIALALTAASGLASYASPPGTVLHFPYPFWGIILAGGGFMVMIWAYLSFGRADTAICPTAHSSCLVISGAFRFSRNPMYLGLLGMLLGAAFFLGDLVAFLAPVVFFLILDKVFIPCEEEDLKQTFGARYEEYITKTRRWL